MSTSMAMNSTIFQILVLPLSAMVATRSVSDVSAKWYADKSLEEH